MGRALFQISGPAATSTNSRLVAGRWAAAAAKMVALAYAAAAAATAAGCASEREDRHLV